MFFVCIALPVVSHAAESPLLKEVELQGNVTRQSAGYADQNDSSVQTAVGRFVNVLTSLLGAILIILIFYAGFLWMTSGGNDTQVDKAKSILQHSIIGLAILLAAFAITKFVVYALVRSTRAPDYTQGLMQSGSDANLFSDPQPWPKP